MVLSENNENKICEIKCENSKKVNSKAIYPTPTIQHLSKFENGARIFAGMVCNSYGNSIIVKIYHSVYSNELRIF